MKAKALLIAVLIVSTIGVLCLKLVSNPFQDRLPKEPLISFIPEKNDLSTIRGYGYTLGTWPKSFQGEPIVTKLTYKKGPPNQFIESVSQIWYPSFVELTLYGPRTIEPGMTRAGFEECFESDFACLLIKRRFFKSLFPDQDQFKGVTPKITWIQTASPLGPRGVHLHLNLETYNLDRFGIITENGKVQIFSLKTVKNPIGLEGRDLFLKTLSSLQVKEDLEASRSWMESQLKRTNLAQIKLIQAPRERLKKYINIQNDLIAMLTLDPSDGAPYFHLAGVTHRMILDLMKLKKPIFAHQEAWILTLKPMLDACVKYLRDFKNKEPEIKNLELLLQDILIRQKQLKR